MARYKVVPLGDKYQVKRMGTDEVVGTHPTNTAARAQLSSLNSDTGPDKPKPANARNAKGTALRNAIGRRSYGNNKSKG